MLYIMLNIFIKNVLEYCKKNKDNERERERDTWQHEISIE